MKRKMHLAEAKFEHFFAGPKPTFPKSEIKAKKPSVKTPATTPTPSTSKAGQGSSSKVNTGTSPTDHKNNSPSTSGTALIFSLLLKWKKKNKQTNKQSFLYS